MQNINLLKKEMHMPLAKACGRLTLPLTSDAHLTWYFKIWCMYLYLRFTACDYWIFAFHFFLNRSLRGIYQIQHIVRGISEETEANSDQNDGSKHLIDRFLMNPVP